MYSKTGILSQNTGKYNIVQGWFHGHGTFTTAHSIKYEGGEAWHITVPHFGVENERFYNRPDHWYHNSLMKFPARQSISLAHKLLSNRAVEATTYCCLYKLNYTA